MPQSNFEKLVTDEMNSIKDGLLTVPANEIHRVALQQGRHDGLKIALNIYRRAAHADHDVDA